MGFDLEAILKSGLDKITTETANALGVLSGDGLSNTNTNSDSEPWYKNIFSGFFSGFSSTKGGQDAIVTTGAESLEKSIKGIFSIPVILILVSLLLFLLFRKR